MLICESSVDVRYPDCDRMGIVHHAVYPIWYEIARMDFFTEMGFPFLEQDRYGINPAMVDLHLRYAHTVTYPDRVLIRTKILSYAPKKLELSYELSDGAGTACASAVSLHIWTGPDGRSYDIRENIPDLYACIEKAAAERQ